MPIRIQRIEPEGPPLSSVPYARATPDTFGAGVAQEGIRAGEALQKIGLSAMDTMLKVKQELEAEDAKLDMATKFSDLKVRFAQREAQIRESGAVQPKDYAATVGAELERFAGESLRALKYPKTAGRFQAQLAPFLAEQKIGALNQGIKLQHAQTLTSADLLDKQDINTAVFGLTPQEKGDALGRFLDRTSALVQRGVLANAGPRIASAMREIELGGVRRDWMNPALRPAVFAMLAGGALQHVDPDAQLNLLKTLQDQAEADVVKQDATAKKDWEEFRRPALTELMRRAMDKTLTRADLDTHTIGLRLSKDELQDIRHEWEKEKPEKATPSDPATLDRVILGTHGLTPTMGEQELNALRAEGLLSVKDWMAAIDKRSSTLRHLEERGQSLASQQHGQAEQELRAALDIPPGLAIIEKMNPETARAWSEGLRELRLRSNAFPDGKEPPLKVIEDMLPRIKERMGNRAQMKETELLTTLSPEYRPQAMMPQSVAEAAQRLEAARVAGGLSQRNYELQRDRLLELRRVIETRWRAVQQKLQDREAGAGAGSSPGGGPSGGPKRSVPAKRPD